MADLTFQNAPNRITQSIAGADTGWHQVAIPSGVPKASGVVNATVAITTVATGGAGAGALVLVDFDKASSPTVGFPIFGGAIEVFGYNNSIWYKLSVATDTLYLIYSF